nr:reverse transcriptase zinc-binding domain-containing protein [Tanacetum cinerariifolium]
MENANPSCSISNREFLDPKKKKEIESWLGDSRIVDSVDGSNKIEYFNTFPTIEELKYHEWILKYPKPSWVKAKIRNENLNNVKIYCKMGHFLKRQAYIHLESPINVMSKQHYNKIMNKETTSIIDHRLGEVVFGKPFARNTSLVYDREEGTLTFEKDDKKITFKMPHNMEASNRIDFKDINIDSILPFVLGSNNDRGKSYYSDSLTLGPEYREDEKYMKKVVKDVAEDEDFKSGSWFSATDYVNDNGDTVTIHYKVIGEGGYGKNITVGAVLILANVLIFSPKPSMHYLNITMRNVVKVFLNALR